MTRQKFNKLATIYRLCAALEVEPTDVLPRITGMCDKPFPDVYVRQDGKHPEKSGEKLREVFDDAIEGSKA